MTIAPPTNRTEIPESLKSLDREIATYRRELPQLIAEGHEGRIALIKGDQVVSVWDTHSDAVQAGHQQFGLEPFLAQPVDSRDIDRLACLVLPGDAACPS